MATSRPDFLPAWATNSFALAVSGQQNKVRPPAGWRTNGWDETEEPPCNYENWQKNRTYQWLEYFDNNAIRCATAFVAASNATDPMKDLATTDAGTGLNKWLCDGTGDDVEIQAAIDAVEAAGGGLVLLSEGTFSFLGGLTIDSNNVALAGMGRGTILQVVSTSAFAFDVITIDTVANCVVRDLSIDGNKGAQIISPGSFSGVVANNATHCLIERLSIHDLYQDTTNSWGIQVKGGSSVNDIIDRCNLFNGTAGEWDIEITAGSGAVVSECRSTLGIKVTAADTRICDNRVAGGPIAVAAGGVDSQIHGNRISGGTNGIEVAVVSNVSIQGNYISGTTEDGIRANTCSELLIAGNIIMLCGFNGIELTLVNDSEISGNKIKSISQAATNTYDGIAVMTNCNDLVIIGNQVRTRGVAPENKFGLFVTNAGPAPTNIWVNNNDFYNSGLTGAFSDAGAITIYPLLINPGGAGGYHVWDPLAGPAAHVNVWLGMFNRVA